MTGDMRNALCILIGILFMVYQKEMIYASGLDEIKSRDIRVLLTNLEGDYYFQQINYQLGEKQFTLQLKDIEIDEVKILKNVNDSHFILYETVKEVTGMAYPGIVEARRSQKGIYLINQVPIEDYLYGVVPSEMPANYPKEALMAQAVCARSYCMKQMLGEGMPDFYADLDDTVKYQVYRKQSEQIECNQAIDATCGKVLMDGDEIAELYFYSTSCGKTADVSVWDADLCLSAATCINRKKDALFEQFIKAGNEDDLENEEPWYRWKYQVQQFDVYEFFRKALTQYLKGHANIYCKTERMNDFSNKVLVFPGKIRSIVVSNRSQNGCAMEVTINGTGCVMKILTEYNIRNLLKNGDYPVLLQNQQLREDLSIVPSGFFTLECSHKSGDVIGYTLIGGGLGHGIGMSQNGAKCMAKKGYSYETILNKYYPEYKIEELK